MVAGIICRPAAQSQWCQVVPSSYRRHCRFLRCRSPIVAGAFAVAGVCCRLTVVFAVVVVVVLPSLLVVSCRCLVVVALTGVPSRRIVVVVVTAIPSSQPYRHDSDDSLRHVGSTTRFVSGSSHCGGLGCGFGGVWGCVVPGL